MSLEEVVPLPSPAPPYRETQHPLGKQIFFPDVSVPRGFALQTVMSEDPATHLANAPVSPCHTCPPWGAPGHEDRTGLENRPWSGGEAQRGRLVSS